MNTQEEFKGHPPGISKLKKWLFKIAFLRNSEFDRANFYQFANTKQKILIESLREQNTNLHVEIERMIDSAAWINRQELEAENKRLQMEVERLNYELKVAQAELSGTTARNNLH